MSFKRNAACTARLEALSRWRALFRGSEIAAAGLHLSGCGSTHREVAARGVGRRVAGDEHDACGLRGVLGDGTFKSPVEIIAALSARSPEAAQVLARQLELFRPRLIVNQARTPQDAEVGPAVVAAWRKFFGLEMDHLGHLPYEDDMWRAARARKTLLAHNPAAAAARCFARIADRLSALDAARVRSEGMP